MYLFIVINAHQKLMQTKLVNFCANKSCPHELYHTSFISITKVGVCPTQQSKNKIIFLTDNC
jgi:hypothetical protein